MAKNVLNQGLNMAKREVGVNERGFRVGEDSQKAKLSDDDVALILQVMEDADEDKQAGRKYLRDCEIAVKFEISKSHVHNIRHGKQRAQAATRYVTVLFKKDK